MSSSGPMTTLDKPILGSTDPLPQPSTVFRADPVDLFRSMGPALTTGIAFEIGTRHSRELYRSLLMHEFDLGVGFAVDNLEKAPSGLSAVTLGECEFVFIDRVEKDAAKGPDWPNTREAARQCLPPPTQGSRLVSRPS